MSDHCPRCRFDPHEHEGPRACPVTALYWDFLARNAERLEGNHRMRGPLRALRGREASGRLEVSRDRAAHARRELDGAAAP
jgi:deoxyribodipyrimidine photolyase-related protein